MSKAVKSLWNLSKDELARERLEAEETHRRDSVAILEYARNEGIEQGIKKTVLSQKKFSNNDASLSAPTPDK